VPVKMRAVVAVFVALFCVSSVLANLGIDMSQDGAPSQSQWDCFKNSYGDSFAIVQTWDGGYQLSSHGTPATSHSQLFD
jgi:hypothetical protein